MGTPFFSVVIDNYNYGRFLAECLDSVLAQDFPAGEVEVIVVDDGSTDESRAVLKRYAPRVRAVLQENQGQAAAFNRGLSEAKGEVVCLLDSDDVWRRRKLSSIAGLFDDKAVLGAEHFLEDTDAALKPLPQRFPLWPPRYTLDDFLEGRTEFTATTGLAYRREALRKALPIPRSLFYYLDDFLTVGVLKQGPVANLPVVLGAHRVHGDNWCFGGLGDARKLERELKMRELFTDALRLPGPWRANWDNETIRRRLLLHALSARPVEAFEEWKKLRAKKASLLLAVLSPDLYLEAYKLYSRWNATSRS